MPIIISPDTYRYTREGAYRFHRETEPSIWGLAYRDLTALLGVRNRTLIIMVGAPGSGKSTWAQQHLTGDVVVFDATSTTKSRRAPLIALAKGYQARIECVFMETALSTCLARNTTRRNNRWVPVHVIEVLHSRMEPPALEEGLDSVRVIASAWPDDQAASRQHEQASMSDVSTAGRPPEAQS